MNITQFYEDHNIPYVSEGHKHCRIGWVQIECPFCTGNPGFHLGYHIESERFHCWRCGHKNSLQVISKLLSISFPEAKKIIHSYSSHKKPHLTLPNETTPLPLIVPGSPLGSLHKKYLQERKFNPEALEEKWGLLGTGFVGSYKMRIIAPVHHNNRLVSFQGRDITNQSPMKYKACPKEREIVCHKHTLYGLDKAIWGSCVVVEGITDVWRLGEGAVATFGIAFTIEQVDVLSKRFDKVFVLYDNEPTAKKNALRLCHYLSSLEVCCFFCDLDVKDPALLPDQEAIQFMKDTLKK